MLLLQGEQAEGFPIFIIAVPQYVSVRGSQKHPAGSATQAASVVSVQGVGIIIVAFTHGFAPQTQADEAEQATSDSRVEHWSRQYEMGAQVVVFIPNVVKPHDTPEALHPPAVVWV